MPRREKPIGGEIPTVLDSTSSISPDPATDLTEKAQNADIGHSNDPPDESIRHFLLHSKIWRFTYILTSLCADWTEQWTPTGRNMADRDAYLCEFLEGNQMNYWHEGGGEGARSASVLGRGLGGQW